MKISNTVSALLLGVIVAFSACGTDEDEMMPPKSMNTYSVKVSNLTAGQPMSPVLVSSASLFSVGEVASLGLEKLAEGGDNTQLLDINGVSGVGLLTPGSSETFAAFGVEGFNATRDDSDIVTLHAGIISKDDGLTTSALSAFEKWSNPAVAVKITRTK